MAKCRMLIQENQELGRQLSQGRVAQLEAELALQKKYSDELKGSQDGEYNQELSIDLVWPGKVKSAYEPPPPPPPSYSREFWIGVCREGSWTLTLI